MKKKTHKAPAKRKTVSNSAVPDKTIEESPEILVESPHAILDGSVSDAARLLVGVANGTIEASREQLSAAQDILNRNGITSSANRSNAIPEAFAREALSNVFRLLGFPAIQWPHLTHVETQKESDTSIDDFNNALLEN